MLSGATSDSTVRSQVWRDRPDLQFQTLGKGATLDLSARLWSMDGLARAMWLKNLRHVVQMTCMSGGWSVHLRNSLFGMCSLQGLSGMFIV